MIPPAGDGVPSLYVTCVLLALSWFTIVLRVWVRIRVEAFGLDDWLMCIGLVSLVPVLFFSRVTLMRRLPIASVHRHGWLGNHLLLSRLRANVREYPPLGDDEGHQGKFPSPPLTTATLPSIRVGNMESQLFFIAEFFYASCTVPIKCSICVTLLRIATARRPYELFLYGLVGLVVVSAIIFNVAVGNLCKPIEALWGEKQGVCSPSLNSSVSFFFSAVAIVTDWSLAIVPGFLLWNVQMKDRVKISVALILGLAALCVVPPSRLPDAGAR